MLYRLGHGAARHHWWVVGAWVLLLAGLLITSATLPHHTKDVFTIPGAESQEALDLLTEKFPQFADPTASVVFHSTDGKLTDDDNAEAIRSSVKNLDDLDEVSSATDPTSPPFSEINLSSDATIGYSTVSFSKTIPDLPKDVFDDVEKATEPAVKAGLDVQYGGEVIDLFDPPDPGISEYADEIGLLIAALILVISFGAVVAAGLPLMVALGALAASAGTLAILEHFFTIGSLNPVFGTMLGLGVGIDYSLLVVNRYLQDRRGGMGTHEAAGQAVTTAGRAVIFAGFMICLATIALALIGIPYVTVLGLTSALYVAFTVVAVLTLLPAVLGLLGRHIESIALPWAKRRRERAQDPQTTFWGRWARTDRRLPWLFGGIALVVLVVLAIPVRDTDLGFDSDGNLPEDTTQRQAYDLLDEGFGPGVNGPLLVAAELPGSDSSDIDSDLSALESLTKAFNEADDVAEAYPPIENDEKTAGVIEIIPASSPSSPKTTDLVKNLRDSVIPDTLHGTSLSADKVFVGGQTAEFIDFTDQIVARLPLFVGAVLGGALLLLLIVLRSILIPLKAVLLNLLMFGVSMGLVVVVFQWEWAASLIGVDTSAPIEPFIPLMLFGVLFGLSTDYEVFLMSRIREEYDRLGDARAAVISGVGTTGRVVASAALIMAAVFLSFVSNPQIPVKMIGLGLGLGILIDGLVVRLVVVPSLLQLMGRSAWWFPSWLDRILPKVTIDAKSQPEPVDPG